MLILIPLATFLVIVGAPETAFGRILRRWMVVDPARILSKLTPTAILLAMVAAAAGILIVNFAESEGLRVLGMMLPEGLLWLTAFDIATLLDVFAAVGIVAAAARFDRLKAKVRAAMIGAARCIAAGLPLRPRASRQTRLRRRSKTPSAKSDDADTATPGWVPVWA